MIKSFDEDTRHSIIKDSSFFEIMQVTVKTTKAKIKIDGKEENSSITSVSTRVQSKTKSFIRNSTNDINTTAHHETAIRGGIRCKEIPCYMSYLTCKWRIVKNAKMFRSFIEIFLNPPACEKNIDWSMQLSFMSHLSLWQLTFFVFRVLFLFFCCWFFCVETKLIIFLPLWQ